MLTGYPAVELSHLNLQQNSFFLGLVVHWRDKFSLDDLDEVQHLLMQLTEICGIQNQYGYSSNQ
jgi:hypothetical protein